MVSGSAKPKLQRWASGRENEFNLFYEFMKIYDNVKKGDISYSKKKDRGTKESEIFHNLKTNKQGNAYN